MTADSWVDLCAHDERPRECAAWIDARLSAARRTSWTAAELVGADFAEPRFAVDGLIPEGLTFMCGAPKLGKSWLALSQSTRQRLHSRRRAGTRGLGP